MNKKRNYPVGWNNLTNGFVLSISTFIYLNGTDFLDLYLNSTLLIKCPLINEPLESSL